MSNNRKLDWVIFDLFKVNIKLFNKTFKEGNKLRKYNKSYMNTLLWMRILIKKWSRILTLVLIKVQHFKWKYIS